MSPRGFSMVVRLFGDGERGFLTFLQSIEGKKTSGPELEEFLQETVKNAKLQLTRPSEAAAFMMQSYLLLASKRGVTIKLNDGSEIYHVGYGLGGGSRKTIRHDLNTGRTFVRLPNDTYYDPSYRDYLEPLQQIMTDEQNRNQFFRQFFNLHVKKAFVLSDAIKPDVKTALLFYLAIYLAESHRSQMGKVDINSSHWHEDLMEHAVILNIAPKSSVVVRLTGIDAPESRQDFGVSCRKILEKEVLGKSVKVKRQPIKLSFGRVLTEVFLGGKNVNLKLISKGCAWVLDDKKFPPTKEYHLAMSMAKKAKAGLWAAKNPEAPWFFRKKKPTNDTSFENEQD